MKIKVSGQEPLFAPDRFKRKTNAAEQAVQADTDKRRGFGFVERLS